MTADQRRRIEEAVGIINQVLYELAHSRPLEDEPEPAIYCNKCGQPWGSRSLGEQCNRLSTDGVFCVRCRGTYVIRPDRQPAPCRCKAQSGITREEETEASLMMAMAEAFELHDDEPEGEAIRTLWGDIRVGGMPADRAAL